MIVYQRGEMLLQALLLRARTGSAALHGKRNESAALLPLAAKQENRASAASR
jgi:hypothetical protein